MKNSIKIIIFVLAIFFLAFSVWYSPILFKGYLHQEAGEVNLGRNLAQTGLYGAENDLNVLLSSNLVETEANISSFGNKMTVLLYAGIFKTWGELSENQLTLLVIALHSLSLVIFALIVLYLFGFKISLIFSLIYILLPFNWQLSQGLGGYEFVLLFFAFFFLFYLFGLNRKYNYLYLIPAGFFLGLACLSKEAFLLFIPFFFVYLWWKNPKRFLLYIFIPFLILFSYFWLPNAFGADEGGNTYLLLFTTQAPEELKSADFGRYGHLFPDPYTYHFNREEFLENCQNQLNNTETNFFTKASLIKTASNLGIETPGFLERIKVGFVLFFGHLARFFSLEEIGGPFIFLLMLLGIYSLRQRNKYLWGLSWGWILSVIFLFSFVVLVGRNHLMDFNWILALWTALGLVMLAKIIEQYFHFNQTKSKILLFIIILATLYSLILVNHISWNKVFDLNQESSLRTEVYSQKIEELNISDRDVIAVPQSVQRYRLNYLNNKSLVVFREETIKDLLNNDELISAFEKFKVKYVLGYSPALTEEIITKTQIINIADNSVELPQIQISPTKVWFLNLVK